MSSKAEYEARKAKRNEDRNNGGTHKNQDIDFVDILDRMATAFERIADSLEINNEVNKQKIMNESTKQNRHDISMASK